jgi:hypothetical protein
MYAEGERIPPNNRIAFMSMSLAKKMRHPEAARSVEMFSLKMTAEQISKGQQIAAKWWERRQ